MIFCALQLMNVFILVFNSLFLPPWRLQIDTNDILVSDFHIWAFGNTDTGWAVTSAYCHTYKVFRIRNKTCPHRKVIEYPRMSICVLLTAEPLLLFSPPWRKIITPPKNILFCLFFWLTYAFLQVILETWPLIKSKLEAVFLMWVMQRNGGGYTKAVIIY